MPITADLSALGGGSGIPLNLFMRIIGPFHTITWPSVGADYVLSKINMDYETGLCAANASSIIHI
jgi:hypothetical protein